jgi:4-oxalocrotonate tautomerase
MTVTIIFSIVLYGLEVMVSMPYVNVKMVGSLSEDQKAKIAQSITQTLQEVAYKPPEYVYVVFEEIDRENWAMGGTLFSQK